MQLTRKKNDRNTNEPKRMPRVVFIFLMCTLAKDTRTKCGCVSACVQVWTLWMYPQTPATGRQKFVHVQHDDFTTSPARFVQHNVNNTISLSHQRYNKGFVKFFRFNGYTHLFLLHIDKHVFTRFLNQNTCLQRNQKSSHVIPRIQN